MDIDIMHGNFRKNIDAHHDRRFGQDEPIKNLPVIKLKPHSSGRLNQNLFFTQYSDKERAEFKRFKDFCRSISDLGYQSLSEFQFREVNEIHKSVSESGVNNIFSIPAIIEYLCIYGNWNRDVLLFAIPDLSKRKINSKWVKERLKFIPMNKAPLYSFSDSVSSDRSQMADRCLVFEERDLVSLDD
jgi:hypothetical protein